MDADKQGFLRSHRSLIQTIGRCARNADGRVIMYGDIVSDAMKTAIDETKRRRTIQMKYNEEHNIIPQTIKKKIMDVVSVKEEDKNTKKHKARDKINNDKLLKQLEEEMNKAAKELDFERAMELRDIIFEMKVN